METPELLEMHPERLALQHELLDASSVGRLLAICTQEELAKMDVVNLVTALHRVAKLQQGSDLVD